MSGVLAHGGVDPYLAYLTWQNDRTFRTFGTNGNFAHGHVDPNQAVRYQVIPAAAGGDISSAEAAAWNANMPGHVATVFAMLQAAGTGGGPMNWATDDDHVAGTGVAWHSSLTFVSSTTDAEITIEYGEAGAGSLGVFQYGGFFVSEKIIIDDDVDWHWLASPNPAVDPNKFDVFTVLLHEATHAAGLTHFGTAAQGAVMKEKASARNAQGGIQQTLDGSVRHGLLDLYAIPAPVHSVPMTGHGSTWILVAAFLLGWAGVAARLVTNARGGSRA